MSAPSVHMTSEYKCILVHIAPDLIIMQSNAMNYIDRSCQQCYLPSMQITLHVPCVPTLNPHRGRIKWFKFPKMILARYCMKYPDLHKQSQNLHCMGWSVGGSILKKKRFFQGIVWNIWIFQERLHWQSPLPWGRGQCSKICFLQGIEMKCPDLHICIICATSHPHGC